jgi:WD40 repeat protein
MATLRLLPATSGTGNHGGEVFACAYTPDGASVLSGGWDGHLRLWEAASGAETVALRVSPKPVSACAVSPDGKQWLSGSLDGLLTFWNADTRQRLSALVPCGRPLSGLSFADDNTLVVASWDGNLLLMSLGRDRSTRTLAGHGDIVAGCRFTPCGRGLLSWSHDHTARLWDLPTGRTTAVLKGHADRVIAGDVSPDGRLAVTGSRDHVLKVWDAQAHAELATLTLPAEVRGCFFLLDGETLLTVEASGRLALFALPELRKLTELNTRLAVQCAALAPSGGQLALGCDDGRVRFTAVEGFEGAALAVTATEKSQRTATGLQKLFGRSRLVRLVAGTCPVCRREFELPGQAPRQPWQCPGCKRSLRVGAVRPEPQPA